MLFGTYLMTLAILSPCPPLVGTSAGVVLVVSIMGTGLVSQQGHFTLSRPLRTSPLPPSPTFRCFHGYCVQACSRTSRWRSAPCYTVEAGRHCSQLVWPSRWALCWAPLPCSPPPASTEYFTVARTVWTSVAPERGHVGVTSPLSPPGGGPPRPGSCGPRRPPYTQIIRIFHTP